MLRIILQDEVGDQLESAEDPGNLLVRMLPPISDRRFRCLPFIDPYADTVFNRLQIDELIQELEHLEKCATTAQERELLRQIRRFATRVQEDYHLYIKFQGD